MQQFFEDVNHAWVMGFFLKCVRGDRGVLVLWSRSLKGNMDVRDQSAPGYEEKVVLREAARYGCKKDWIVSNVVKFIVSEDAFEW
jgi:hypothetical protein